MLQYDPVVHALVLRQHCVDRHRGEHPVLDGLLFQDFLVVDEVTEPILAVAVDDDAEHILDGIAVPVEGAASQGNPFANLGLQPKLVDLAKR